MSKTGIHAVETLSELPAAPPDRIHHNLREYMDLLSAIIFNGKPAFIQTFRLTNQVPH